MLSGLHGLGTWEAGEGLGSFNSHLLQCSAPQWASATMVE